MNKNKLKAYAPQARKDFIAAVTARANLIGLSESSGKLEVAIGEKKGDIAIIAGREWPAKVYEQRERLIRRMKTEGFSHTVEAIAYTWFNRFAALRYMEIHDYLDHGHRVLSNREGGMPEILNHATDLDLPGFNKTKAIDLKLAGNKDNELYKLILVAQCNALSNAMPFLFERIDDETELLLPDNLLRTDSITAKLVEEIPEEDWQEVEIIGWLYQFYISEKKDEVIGKVVKSEDIPAATQLFTPNWIVQYLVQNSVGRLWLSANPASALKSQWPYYIEPAEQTPDVGAALAAITQTRMDEDGGSLNPETITMLDPACGSGHILVVGYDVLKAIYLERGYQLRAIPRLILEKNLYGLDIDDRAAQMAGFALLMKARADDRRLFDNPPKLNVLALQESKGLNADEIAQALSTVRAEYFEAHHIHSLIDTFAHAKTYGSLIQIPQEQSAQLAMLAESLQQSIQNGDLYAKAASQDLLPFVRQAMVLGMQFDAVVANPPYMGSKYYSQILKIFVNREYQEGKADLYGCFIQRNLKLSKTGGTVAMITIPNWMFLSSFEELRTFILSGAVPISLVHNGRGVFGSDFGSCSFIIQRAKVTGYLGVYKRLFERQGEVNENEDIERAFHINKNHEANCDQFEAIPGAPFAYWAGKGVIKAFRELKPLSSLSDARQGLITGNNNSFVRQWHEVDISKIGFLCTSRADAKEKRKKWFPYNKGGEFRKWYGNYETIVNWENDGEAIRNFVDLNGDTLSRPQSMDYYFRQSITWSRISASFFGVRFSPIGAVFDCNGPSLFCFDEMDEEYLCALLLSKVSSRLLEYLNPTLTFQVGDILKLPTITDSKTKQWVAKLANQAIQIAKADWNSFETAFDFVDHPLIGKIGENLLIASAWEQWDVVSVSNIATMKSIEEEINSKLIEAYGLQDELSPEVPENQITLARADREKDCQRLISYAIGCMMGRYSLDEPGLIYAHAANVCFDATRYPTFPADSDGIVPLTDELWFEDDAANRIREFLRAVWGAETLEENLSWLAESLGKKGNETPDETIRRYLSGSFFKDHLQTYKKRPIYWLFSSGKQGAFQALVYLHRYHEGTLARMRSEYVVPLTGKIQSRIEMLEKDVASEGSTAARNKISKEIEGLRKKHVEILAYDEKLRHYADQRIKLDLDDGVKVNYGKFGDLLAEVKAITGGAEE